MKYWNDFREIMKHEMEDVDVDLSIFGYKLDGKDGIKKSIRCDQFKSVDYIADSRLFSLVEFSDLYRDKHEIKETIDAVYNSNIGQDKIKKIKRQLNSKMQQELVTKFKDSISIIQQMQSVTFCNELSHYNNNKKIKYVIVIAPFHHSIPECKKIELAKVINQLKTDITSSLPKYLNATANIILVDKINSQHL
jgi:hypothetical protein